MTLTASSCLHFWSSRYGPVPIIGGKPVHTRSSAARTADQRGVIYAPIINTPRPSWDTIDGERRTTLLLEQARTNAFTYSEEFDNAVWTKTTSSITANAVIAPDGTLTGDKLVESVDNTNHYVAREMVAPTANTPQSVSVFARAGERTWVAISTIDLSNTAVTTFVNLATGAVGTTHGDHTTTVRTLANGWYRIEVVRATSSGVSTPYVRVFTASADNTTSYQGNGTSGIYIWGAQFETDKGACSSYIPTASSTASRSADTLYFDYPAPPQGMLAYVRFVESGSIKNTDSAIWDVTGATALNPRTLVYRTSAGYRGYHHNGTTELQTDVLGTSPALGDTVELLFVLAADGSAQLIQSINGGAVTNTPATAANTLASAWGGTRLWLNSFPASHTGMNRFAEIKFVKFADVAASTAQGRMDELRDFEVGASGEVLS